MFTPVFYVMLAIDFVIILFGLAVVLDFKAYKRNQERARLDIIKKLAFHNDQLQDFAERFGGIHMKMDAMSNNFIHKTDKTYMAVMKVLRDASGQSGEGLFLVRHMAEDTYLWRVDKKDVVELSPKEIEQK